MPNFHNVEALFCMEHSDNSINSGNVGTSSEEQKLDLKKIRESKGLTLREISRITRISHTVLGMIEIERFDALPEPLYSTAFIRTYADALGVDGEEVLYRYNRYLKEQELSGKHNKVTRESWIRSHRSLVVWSVVAIVIVLSCVLYFIQRDDAKKESAVGEKAVAVKEVYVPPSAPRDISTREETTVQPEPAPQREASPPVVIQEETVVQSSAENALREEEPRETPAQEEGPHRLTITAKELTWLKIGQDGGESSEILLRPGEKLDKEAREGFVVVVGNAGGVDVVFDGTSLGTLGSHGQVVSLNLPQERSR